MGCEAGRKPWCGSGAEGSGFEIVRSDLHRRVPRRVKLVRVLLFQEKRVVQND
jgi:hypothetical protein